MRFKEIASRLTGFSVPVFGVSWNPPEPEIKTARRIISFLEDRRVLYSPYELEVPEHCVQSIIEIRHFLTGEIATLPSDSELSDTLRALRATCRKFLDSAQANLPPGRPRGSFTDWTFNSGLGELRGIFGIHLAKIAAQHGLDIEDDLAVILPASAEDTNESKKSLSRSSRKR
jgi:hypothetical protein